MEGKTQTIDFKVKSEVSTEYDHFLANDEPNNETATLIVEPLSDSPVRKVQYRFHWRDWIRTFFQTNGYEDYERFKSIRLDDLLRITYSPPYYVTGKEREKVYPKVLAVVRGDYDGGPIYPQHSSTIESIENLTQKWKIE